jgi:hypothetical protein
MSCPEDRPPRPTNNRGHLVGCHPLVDVETGHDVRIRVAAMFPVETTLGATPDPEFLEPRAYGPL